MWFFDIVLSCPQASQVTKAEAIWRTARDGHQAKGLWRGRLPSSAHRASHAGLSQRLQIIGEPAPSLGGVLGKKAA